MKCFIHSNEEAVAACKKCGKGMCANCSAYSDHSGICPECRREDFIREREDCEMQARDYKKGMVWNIVWCVLLCWTVIAIPWNLISFFMRKSKRAKVLSRINFLTEEITKLTKALNTGSAII
ncbi:MAG: hypothetical protein E7349_06995 [Clostridiales bacterium]|nr:hypothetical protein [Clostridiales bacterium]